MARITPKPRVLVVDDDRIVLDSLAALLRAEGCHITAAESADQALTVLQAERIELVLSDVVMPGGDGLNLLRRVRRDWPDVVVILLTGYGTVASAIEAIKCGAQDYLTKPLDQEQVRLAVRRGLQQRRLAAEDRRPPRLPASNKGFPSVVGSDAAMAKVFELVEAVAPTATTVLLTGESGTGKSLIARAIHDRSDRPDKPFVEVACGALPETLLESELFGHVRGAFTGAVSDKPGKFAAADGGTIFLDEIATASPQLQVKLLRVLQDSSFEPVGGNTTCRTDARVLLATNRDLAAEVAAGRFREDLYYRVNVVAVHLPPLRERIGEVPLLAEHFLAMHLAGGRPGARKLVQGFSPEALALMQRHSWPGNVRELANCVERAVVLCRQAYISPADLPPAVWAAAQPVASVEGTTLAEAVCETESRAISAALAANNGSRNATARQLGIDRTTLYKKMKRLGLTG